MSDTVRAFIAIRPSQDVLDRIAAFQAELRDGKWGGSFRSVQVQNLHVTLCFLGTVGSTAIGLLTSALAAATEQTACLELQCSGLGCFPDCRRPSVLWTSLEGDVESLRSLQASVIEHCASFGSHRETKPFRPHLTVARSRTFDARLGASLQSDLDRFAGRNFGHWTCSSVSLVSSHVRDGGPEYTDLATVPLTGAKTR